MGRYTQCGCVFTEKKVGVALLLMRFWSCVSTDNNLELDFYSQPHNCVFVLLLLKRKAIAVFNPYVNMFFNIFLYWGISIVDASHFILDLYPKTDIFFDIKTYTKHIPNTIVLLNIKWHLWVEEMKPMARNQQVWAWFCICQSNANSNSNSWRIRLSAILIGINLSTLGVPIYGFLHLTNAEDFFFTLYQFVGILMAISNNVVLILKRHKISLIFEKFTTIFNECKFFFVLSFFLIVK